MDTLQKIISKKNYFALYESSLICEKSKKILKKILNKDIQVISFKNGYLKIKSVDVYFDNDIRCQRYEIVKAINDKIGKKMVKKISIVKS